MYTSAVWNILGKVSGPTPWVGTPNPDIISCMNSSQRRWKAKASAAAYPPSASFPSGEPQPGIHPERVQPQLSTHIRKVSSWISCHLRQVSVQSARGK